MYVRNEANGNILIVKDAEAVAKQVDLSYSVKWLFRCVLEVIHFLDGTTSEVTRAEAVLKLDRLLDENPGLIHSHIVCDATNNPPDVVAKLQTVITVNVLFDANRGEYLYSFSTKELA